MMITKADGGDLSWIPAVGKWTTAANFHLWGTMGEWYCKSALALYASMQQLEDTGHADVSAQLLDQTSTGPYCMSDDYVVPFLFLARHGTELLVKMVCLASDCIKGVPLRKFSKHKFGQDWVDAKDVIKEFGITWGSAFDAMDGLVQFFKDLDPDSTHYRYPIDTKGQNVLGCFHSQDALADNSIDLTAVATALKEVHYLSHLADEMDAIYQHRADMASYYS